MSTPVVPPAILFPLPPAPLSAPLAAAQPVPALPIVAQSLQAPTTPKDEGGQAPGGFDLSSLFPIVMVAAIFWFVVIGPERKNRKAREAMLAGIKKGDKVVTTGGLYGHVAQVQDQVVTLTVADGVRMRFARHAIQSILAEEPAKEGAAS
jgi:preprotein translocase subunit YajC